METNKTGQIYRITGDASRNKQVMPAKLYANRMAWVEYVQRAADSAVIWELCTMEIGVPGSRKIIASNKDNPAVQFPRFDMEQDLIVYDKLVPDGKDRYDSPLYIYTISGNLTTQVIRIPGYDLFAPDIQDKQLVFCKLALSGTGAIQSELAVYDLAHSRLSDLKITTKGYEPALYGNYLVFKEASSLYAYGHIKLYDLKNQSLTALSTAEPGGAAP